MNKILEQDSEKLELLRRIERLQELVCDLLARNEHLRKALKPDDWNRI